MLRLGMMFWSNLGSCSCCVRSAFRAAFVACIMAGLCQAISLPSQFLILTGAAACALTALWLGHLLAHAIRVSMNAGEWRTGQSSQKALSRRSVIPIFARALVTAAVAASVPTFAFAECDQAAAARCQGATANCRANCDRSFHRAEANHACHQECSANNSACRADAKCM
jgi:hypothetical protein